MMKPFAAITALIIRSMILLAVTTVHADVPFQDGDRVLFLGDSITQDGRYVALAEAYLWAQYPGRNIDVVGAGLSSETASGLTEPVHPYPRPHVHERLARALDLVKPNWVVACYGMNDGIYHPAEPRIIDAYRVGLIKLVDDCAARGAKVILLTPPSFDISVKPIQARLGQAAADEPYGYKNPTVDYDKTLVALGDVVKSLADHQGVERVIDIHEVTDRYLRRVKNALPDYQYGDGVHPPLDGHLTMACGLIDGLEAQPSAPRTLLTRLTGIQSPLPSESTASDAQSAFREALFKRFSSRSAAYRKAIGFVAPFQFSALSIEDADQVAGDQKQKLRDEVAVLKLDDQAFAPYLATATKRWENDIAELEKLDLAESHADDAILFIGSSSIRLWDKIDDQMQPYQVIKRGYGGAKFSDLAVFAKRLIQPHPYRAMVVFVGNDISGSPDDRTPEEVEALARYVCEVSQAHQRGAPIFIVEVTPTPLRFAHWPRICGVNSALRQLALTTPNIYFVATAQNYLTANKQPRAELFRDDRLHQNDNGYVLWSSLIKRKLDEVLASP